MKSFASCSIFTAVLLAALAAPGLQAVETGARARIVAITGTGQATIVSGGESHPAQKGDTLGVSDVVRTTSQEVYIEVVPGVVASVRSNSEAKIDQLAGAEPELHLERGSLINEIDRSRVAGQRTFKVHTAKGVAAARGTSFTVTVGGDTVSVLTTADSVQFTNQTTGQAFTIKAGQIAVVTPGVQPTEGTPITQVAANPEVGAMLNEAVEAVATVVSAGSISADSATNLVAQVVAAASAALPNQAADFTAQGVKAVVASSATPESAAIAAGAVTAAVVATVPAQAAQIAGAAAAAAPAQAATITAAAQLVAPQSKDAIAQSVADRTGQNTQTVQANADAAASQATTSVNVSKDATSNLAPQTSTGTSSQNSSVSDQNQQSQNNSSTTSGSSIVTPTTPIDPSLGISPSS
jgi:hypothetical protein